MKTNKLITFITFLLLSISNLANQKSIILSSQELKSAGEKIFLNETGGNKDMLIHWNVGEEFASLGIGHFIWYPKNFDGPFDESFPGLVSYYRDQGIKLPLLFEDNIYCPWNTKDEFFKDKDNPLVRDAIDFLDSTKDIQTNFIYERLQSALKGMLLATENEEHVEEQFYRMVGSKGGLYPLIDYVNFKGEGIKPTERYNNLGWGLLQILENMKGLEKDEKALEEFRTNAKFVLKRRVDNSPKERGEDRWLLGWNKRIDTYY